MKIDIKGYRYEMTDEIRNYAADKIGRLDKYFKNILRADIRLEDERGTVANKFACKVILEIPGEDLYAEEHCTDMHEAIDKVEGKLIQQIKKAKEKQDPSKIRRARHAIRKFFGKE